MKGLCLCSFLFFHLIQQKLTKIISYARRALTPVEQRYSQTEREALAVVFGCEKFHRYLYCNSFVVITDHKPLVAIYNNPRSNPPARIEQWTLRLQQYDLIVKYRLRTDNQLTTVPDIHWLQLKPVEPRRWLKYTSISSWRAPRRLP